MFGDKNWAGGPQSPFGHCPHTEPPAVASIFWRVALKNSSYENKGKKTEKKNILLSFLGDIIPKYFFPSLIRKYFFVESVRIYGPVKFIIRKRIYILSSYLLMGLFSFLGQLSTLFI